MTKRTVLLFAAGCLLGLAAGIKLDASSVDATADAVDVQAACPPDTGAVSDLNFDLNNNAYSGTGNFGAVTDGEGNVLAASPHKRTYTGWKDACVTGSTHWKPLSDETAGPDCLAFDYESYEDDLKTKAFEDIPHLCVGCYAIFEIALNPFCVFGPCGGRPFPSNKQWGAYRGNTVQFWWALGMCAWAPIEETIFSYFSY